MFQMLMKDPLMMRYVNAFVAGSLATCKPWFESFPLHEILPDGGEGHDISALHHAFPLAPEKLILQVFRA
jgi:hypothetical protein